MQICSKSFSVELMGCYTGGYDNIERKLKKNYR